MSSSEIRYIVDKDGTLQGVVISAALWEKVRQQVLAVDAHMHTEEDLFSRPQPMDAVAELKKSWDFKYPYDAKMHCDACGASTENWEEDPLHPFHLLNANFGGLMVFACRHCGAHIRKKHFWHKVVYECDAKPGSE